nr:hypothetical protein [uncultured Mediterranean phage uvMED]
MALVVADRVKETTTTTGTGAITLAGAETNFVTFSSALSNGDTTYYAIIDDTNNAFEVGLGTFSSGGNSITRTTVLASSNSGSAVDLSAGTKEVFVNYPAGKAVFLDASGDANFSGAVNVTSTSAIKLPVGTTAQRPTPAQGQIRYNTTTSGFEGYNGSSWGSIGAEFAYTRTSATATSGQTTFSATYTVGYVDVYLNGAKLVVGTDVTATNGSSVVLASGATTGDSVEIIAYETFAVANALLAANNLSDVASAATALSNLGVTSTAAELNILDGVTASTAELNILDGVTSTTSELNILDGVTATAAEINYLDITTLGTSQASKAVTADANGVVTFDNGISEEYNAVTSSSNATTVNLRDGTNFSHTLTENTTFTFSNPATSGKVSAFTLKIVQDGSASGFTVTWPGSVDWPAATAPTLTATANAVDYFVFITHDGGTTYYGFTAGQALG